MCCVCCVVMCSYECAVCAVCAMCIHMIIYNAIAWLNAEICTAWMVLYVYYVHVQLYMLYRYSIILLYVHWIATICVFYICTYIIYSTTCLVQCKYLG